MNYGTRRLACRGEGADSAFLREVLHYVLQGIIFAYHNVGIGGQVETG
jgi:hypothetical protein